MPGVQEHLVQAGHNETFFGRIDVGSFSDWAVTVLFYSALHYIDAYLATQGYYDPGGHDVREDLIRRDSNVRPLYPSYARLKNFSRSARYYGSRYSDSQVTGLYRGSFEPIKRHLLTRLNPPPR